MIVEIVEGLLVNWKSLTTTSSVTSLRSIKDKSPNPDLFRITELEDHLINGKNEVNEDSISELAPDIGIADFVGERINEQEYIVDKKLGEGGFAIVYKGKYNKQGSSFSGKDIAIKTLINNEGLKEFRHEVTIQGRLKHPSIVNLIAMCLRPFTIIMELVRYGDLNQLLLNHSEVLSFDFKVRVLTELASALHYMHTYNPPILHLDFKSPNVLVNNKDPRSEEVCIKLTDFGTSRFQFVPIKGRFVDNPSWLAPEILRDQFYDTRVDTYAYGIVCWELIARKIPFSHFDFMTDIENEILAGGRPTLPNHCPEIYKQITERCWAQDPEQRPGFDWVLDLWEQLRDDPNFDLYIRPDEEYQANVKEEAEKKKLEDEKNLLGQQQQQQQQQQQLVLDLEKIKNEDKERQTIEAFKTAEPIGGLPKLFINSMNENKTNN